MVRFGAKLTFPAQLLGTESNVSRTGLWADANKNIRCPSTALCGCRRVRCIGREWSIEEFVSDSILLAEEVDRATGHGLAMVATCLAEASCYYRGPHEKGAVYFMISDARIDREPGLDREQFRTAFNELMWFPGDMKKRTSLPCF